MQDDELKQLERISALADGHLDGDELAQTVAWAVSSEQARVAWHAYHVMGDVLRSADLTDCSRDRLFASRVCERLAQIDASDRTVDDADAVFLTPSRPDRIPRPAPPMAPMPPAVADTAVRSANDAVLRWKWLAAAASVMAVAVLGWHVDQLNADAPMRLATTPAAGATVTAGALAAGTAPAPVMLRDARLDELLAAHRQFSGVSALQTPAGFLRNATFEAPAR